MPAAAVPHFEKAEQLLDSEVDALHAYSTCLVRLKRLDDAAGTLQKAVALHPDDPRERQVLASIQLMDHKSKDAIATLQPLRDAQNVDSTTLQLASRAYEDSGDTPQAVSTLRQAILLVDPKNVSLYIDFATICFSHESFQVGIDVLTEGLVLQPKSDDLYVARGVLYVQLAQYDKAEVDFEKAYELNPHQSLSTAAQGLAAVQANDLDHALASIQEKLKRKPNDPLLLYLQADVLSQKGVDPGTPNFQLAIALCAEIRRLTAHARGIPRRPRQALYANRPISVGHRTVPQSARARSQGSNRRLSPDPGAAKNRPEQGNPRPASAPCPASRRSHQRRARALPLQTFRGGTRRQVGRTLTGSPRFQDLGKMFTQYFVCAIIGSLTTIKNERQGTRLP